MIGVIFDRPWSRTEDAGGNVSRQWPAGWRGELPDATALEALADGAAKPSGKLDRHQKKAIKDLLRDREVAADAARARAEQAAAIREEAARIVVASDDELVAMAEQSGDGAA